MDIIGYDLYEVHPRWQFLKLETRDGAVGWGEVYTKWHYAGEERNTATAGAVGQMMDKYVIDADGATITKRWEEMYRSSFFRGGAVHTSAMAGIDQALWDLKGKRYGAPIWELLGGKARDRIRIYHHADETNAAEAVEQGFTAIKMSPREPFEPIATPARVAQFSKRVATARERVGDDIDIGLDFHGRVRRPMVDRLIESVEPYSPMFIEEPVTAEFPEIFTDIAARTSIPIATGERLCTRFDVKPYLEHGSLDVVQPDVSNAAGITETKRIADMAAAYDVMLAPHCPIGPIALAASLQVMVAVPNALIQEQILSTFDGWQAYLVDPAPLEHQDGFIALPTDPGLGVDVDEDVVADRHGRDLQYARPLYTYEDGGIGDG